MIFVEVFRRFWKFVEVSMILVEFSRSFLIFFEGAHTINEYPSNESPWGFKGTWNLKFEKENHLPNLHDFGFQPLIFQGVWKQIGRQPSVFLQASKPASVRRSSNGRLYHKLRYSCYTWSDLPPLTWNSGIFVEWSIFMANKQILTFLFLGNPAKINMSPEKEPFQKERLVFQPSIFE